MQRVTVSVLGALLCAIGFGAPAPETGAVDQFSCKMRLYGELTDFENGVGPVVTRQTTRRTDERKASLLSAYADMGSVRMEFSTPPVRNFTVEQGSAYMSSAAGDLSGSVLLSYLVAWSGDKTRAAQHISITANLAYKENLVVPGLIPIPLPLPDPFEGGNSFWKEIPVVDGKAALDFHETMYFETPSEAALLKVSCDTMEQVVPFPAPVPPSQG